MSRTRKVSLKSCQESNNKKIVSYSLFYIVNLFIVQFSSVALSFLTLCNPMDCSVPDLTSFTNPWSLLKLMSIESVMPSNHLILCCPLLLLPSIFPSIRVFSNESILIRWPKYWSFSFIISPSNEYSGLISFRMDWLDLLVVQGTLKSLLLHHSSKASILQHSAFFIVQLSHPYWRSKWQPTPVLLPGKFHGWRSLVGYSPWGCKELDTTEQLHSFIHVYTRLLEKP